MTGVIRLSLVLSVRPQMFRVRLTEGQDRHQYRDVQPANVSVFTVTGLQASTAYSAAVMAYSRLGDSGYSQPTRLKTTGQCGDYRDRWPPYGCVLNGAQIISDSILAIHVDGVVRC